MAEPRVLIDRRIDQPGVPAVYIGGRYLPVNAVIRAKGPKGKDVYLLAIPAENVDLRFPLDSIQSP